MASRYSGKKKGKKKSGSRSKRSAAAKKAWRTRVRKYGRAGAVSRMFGGKGKGKRGGKRRSSGKRHSSHRDRRLARNPTLVLKAIQRREGTTGLPPTAAEQRLARIISSRSTRVPRTVDAESAAKSRISHQIQQQKLKAAAQILAIKHRERAAAEARDKVVQRQRELQEQAARL